MDCLVCSKIKFNPSKIDNDCVLECLERIRAHYLDFKKNNYQQECALKELKEKSNKLEENLRYEEDTGKSSRKKPRLHSMGEYVPNTQRSEVFENCDIDKSVEDLNIALNDEMEFEFSFESASNVGQNTPNELANQMKDESFIKPKPKINKTSGNSRKNIENVYTATEIQRKPMSNLSILSISKISNLQRKTTNNQNKSTDETIKSCIPQYKCNSKESELGFIKCSKPRSKLQNLSLKSGRLRQTKLQLTADRNRLKTNDSTLREDEAIEASPRSQSSFTRNKSKLCMLGNTSTKAEKSPRDCTFELSPLSPKICSKPMGFTQLEKKELESSSVVMLTPATQDIIFLDDTDGSFNIESMDLLRDLANPCETQFSNLRRIESNGIKQLQKTVNEKAENPTINVKKEITSRESDVFKNIDNNSVEAEDLKETYCDLLEQEDAELTNKNEQTLNEDRVQKLLNINCIECRAYIKYLGTRLSDKEIEQHIRNCTKHKKQVEYDLTPDGFWDPMIQPLDENDPRNEILIDDRFVKNKRHD